MALEQARIKSTDTTVLTVPAGKRYAITTILVCNTADPNDSTVSFAEFDMHFVKQGATINLTNMVINTLELPAGETFTFDSEKIILESGDRVTFVASPPIDPSITDPLDPLFQITNLSATVSFLEV
jgi:hypothetical protein